MSGLPDGRRICWLLLAVLLAVASRLVCAQEGVGLRVSAGVGAPGRVKASPRMPMRTRRFLAGRGSVTGDGAATLLAGARAQQVALLARPRAANLSAAWTPLGPAQVVTPGFGAVTGRVTSIAVDPADASGNTVYLGTTGGGVWKSTNAMAAAAAVTFVPLTDTLPVYSQNAGSSVVVSLSIGAVSVGNGVVLAGTGDPNDATDSYYGGGILRSADGGLTWTMAPGSNDGVSGHHSFIGLSVAGFAWSTAVPGVVVAALTQSAEGNVVNAPVSGSSVTGLYMSADSGQTWQMASVFDTGNVQQVSTLGSAVPSGQAATAVVWNPVRQRFFAVLRGHGYYESIDGQNWVRLSAQPGTGMTLAQCPTQGSAVSCPVSRGALAVQPSTGDTYALTVDANDVDQGLWRDSCAAQGSVCANLEAQFGTRIGSTALENGGASTIAQGNYDLVLEAVPVGSDTALYAGTEDLYRCTLSGGCALRDTTNTANGCAYPAGVGLAQHAIAATGSGALLIGTDAGLWRSIDGAAETGSVCSPGDAGHFDNLNGGLGSLAEIVSFAADAGDAGILLAGLGGLGSAGVSDGQPWTQLAAGEGGVVAIDAAQPPNWLISLGAGIDVGRCAKGSSCTAADFTSTAVGTADVAFDDALIDAPWLLDPDATGVLVAGTCRVWRGPATGGWTNAELVSAPFYAPLATGCGTSAPVVRSLAVGGPGAASGGRVMYAGMAGALDGGSTLGGHVFTTAAADIASGATTWTDAALAPVSNGGTTGTVFNPSGFDLSSVVVDPHDASGMTVYATVMGFSGNSLSVAHVYRSTDGGASWMNINGNLPNAPTNDLLVDPNDANTVYVANDTGVYVTTSVTSCGSGQCWSVYGTGLPNAPATKLVASAGLATGDGRTGLLRVGTYGRGIWSIPLVTAISPALPIMGLSQTSIVFNSQQVGTESQPVSITVTNTGVATLTVTNVVVAGDFVESQNCTGAPIAVGGNCSVAVSFIPQQVGTRTGLLTIYGNVAGGQATVALSGVATSPASVVLTPLSVDFGRLTVGTPSVAQNVTISNLGGQPAGLMSETVTGDFALTANSCGGTLASQTGCTVSVVFTPTASGTRTGSLTVVDAAGTQIAGLLGVGRTPATDQLSVSSLGFGPQVIGSASAAQQVVLTNVGDESLTLTAGAVTGDFTVVNGCGAALVGHASCSFEVAYVPKRLGAESGVLTISDFSRSQAVALTGTGLAPPGISISPVNGLSFAATGVGLASAAQVLTMTNNGGIPLAFTGIAATTGFTLVTNTCGASLAPGGACEVGVSFTPQTAGTEMGTVTFSDSAGGGSQAVGVSGIGVDFTLAASGPMSATIASGASASYLLVLGSSVGMPGSAVFTCAGAPAFATCAVNPVSVPLGVSAGSVVTVTVATGQAGARLSPQGWPWERGGVWLALGLPVGLALRRRRRATGLICMGVAVLSLGACTAARTVPGTTTAQAVTQSATPSGTYTLVLAGSSAGLVRGVNLTLVVQ